MNFVDFVAWLIQPSNWPTTPIGSALQPPRGALRDRWGHEVYSSGQLRAVAKCPCMNCRAVFDDWGHQAGVLPDPITIINHDGLIEVNTHEVAGLKAFWHARTKTPA